MTNISAKVKKNSEKVAKMSETLTKTSAKVTTMPEKATKTRWAKMYCEPQLIREPDHNLRGAGFGPRALSLTHVQ